MTTEHDQDAGQLCVIGHREHRAHDGMLVCTHHAQEIATWLRDIEDQTALLDPRKATTGIGGGKGGTLASQQSPVRLDALVLRDTRRNSGRLTADDHDPLGLDDTPEVLNTLHSWANTVRGERRIDPPAVVTVVGERRLLSTQLPWMVKQDWVSDLHRDLGELVGALRRTNGTQDVSAGTCSTPVDGIECGGTIRHVAFRPDGRAVPAGHADPGDEPGFRCGRCRHTWTGTEAVRLRAQLWLDEQAREATA